MLVAPAASRASTRNATTVPPDWAGMVALVTLILLDPFSVVVQLLYTVLALLLPVRD